MKKLFALLTVCVLICLSACGGGGGGGGAGSGGSVAQVFVDGWPISSALSVNQTSYANKFDGRISDTALQQFDANINPISVTFGDFFQEGKMSAFVAVNRPGQTALAYFLRWKTSESRWVDDSVRLLGDAMSANRNTCESPRYAYTSDFNGDGKPDVYLACALNAQTPQVIFLSQANGSYSRQLTSFSVNGNSATLFDVNGDNKMDVVVSNSTSGNNGWPEVYLGNGAGSFTADNSSRLVLHDTNPPVCGGGAVPHNVDAVFAVPSAQGRVDLIVGSTVTNSAVWLKDLSTTGSTRYSVCQDTSKTITSLQSPTTLTDVYASVSGNNTDYYIVRKGSAASAITVAKYSLSPVVNGGVTTFNLQAGSHPVTISSVSSGIAEMFSLSTSMQLRAFDAGCTTSTARCSSWSAHALSEIQ